MSPRLLLIAAVYFVFLPPTEYVNAADSPMDENPPFEVLRTTDGTRSPITRNWFGLVPDDFKLPADGEDDGPSIQRAIKAACEGQVKSLLFKARRYEINSAIIQDCLANWKGQGYEEQGGTNYAASGTWLDIGPAFLAGRVAPINIVGGTGSMFEDFGVAEPSQPAPPVAAYDPSFPASSATPHIVSFTPSTWSPAPFYFVFNITASPGNVFRHIMLDGVNQGFHIDHSGRTNFEDIRGQVFNTMFDIHESYDTSRIAGVHNWPYWSSADPVMAYTQEHAYAIASYRNDTPFWDDIFGFGLRAVLFLADDPDGTTTGIQAGKISCDSTVYCISISAKSWQVTGQFENVRTFGAKWTSIFPGRSSQYPGSAMLQLDSSAVLQIGTAENYGTDVATFVFNAPRAPSNLMVGSLFVHANTMSPNSSVAMFPADAGTIASLLSIGMAPAIAGTVSGFHSTNTGPNGAGVGFYRYPAGAEVH